MTVRKKAILLFAAVILAVAAVSIPLFSAKPSSSANGDEPFKKSSDFLLYVKEEGLFFTNSGKNEIFLTPLKQADKTSWPLSNQRQHLRSLEDIISASTHISKDGSCLFYPVWSYIDSQMTSTYNPTQPFDLYFRDVKNPEADGIKIDSQVISYTVSESDDLVTYLRKAEEDSAILLQYTVTTGKTAVLDSNAKNYWVSDDGSKTYYLDAEGTLYFKVLGKDKEKLASDATLEVRHITKDFNTVYYSVKGESDRPLYKHTPHQKPQTVIPDFVEINAIYDSGEVYYTTKAGDYNPFFNSYYCLYYFDGYESTLLSSKSYFHGGSASKNSPFIVFYEYDRDTGRSTATIAFRDNVNIRNANLSKLLINDSLTIAYFQKNLRGYTDYHTGEELGDLYTFSPKYSSTSEPQLVAADIHEGEFISDSKFLYFTPIKNWFADLYINNTKIDFAYPYECTYYEEFDLFVYYTDWNEGMDFDHRTLRGTLKAYTRAQSIEIADKVSDYAATTDGRILYVRRQDPTVLSGDLMEWENGKKRKIHENVSAVISLSSNKKYKGAYIYYHYFLYQ